MIQQPHLGKYLAEIRKAKSWTQEDLVEKCNVSVRTIQRIESGEVTPRYSTVKILLAALEYDMDEWIKLGQDLTQSEMKTSTKTLHHMFLINPTANAAKSVLTSAWIAGCVYLLMFIFEICAEFVLEQGLSPQVLAGYAALKVLVAASFIMFMRGFVSLGALFGNYLLKVSAYLYAALIVALALSDIVLAYFFYDNDLLTVAVSGGFSVLLGTAGIVFGLALFRLQDGMGELARFAGIFEIVAGLFFVTVILFFFGVLFLVPVLVLEIVLLFKADELARAGKI